MAAFRVFMPACVSYAFALISCATSTDDVSGRPASGSHYSVSVGQAGVTTFGNGTRAEFDDFRVAIP